MIDELELAFDERPDKGRHRRSRGKGDGSRGGRGKTFAALLMSVVLLGALGGGVWYGFDQVRGYFSAPDYDGGGTGEVTVEIQAGQSLADVGNTLVAADVIKSSKAFVAAAEDNSRSRNIQPGVYKLRRQMSADTALGLLLDLRNKIVNQVTIPEGRTAKQTYQLLSEKSKIPVAEFEAAAKDPAALGVPEFWYVRNDGKPVTRSIEGFLFPQTYEIPPEATADEILREMVSTFLATAEEIKFVETVESGLGGVSPYEALIVASLAQAEAGVPGDLGKVARVAYNRVYGGTFPCGCLEMDVTINYYLELTGQPTKTSKEMLQSELVDTDNPYSRKLRGLVPTPINNPGRQALEGAMAPPEGEWLYFVAIDREGNSAFAETYEAHKRNEDKARELGII